MVLKKKRKLMLFMGIRKPMTVSEYEQMTAVYDELCKKADAILKRFNPCKIKRGRCFSGRGHPCCDDCEFLSKKGCTEKSLACKLWLCPDTREYFPECAALLDELEEIARRHPHIPLGERQIKEDIVSYYKIVY